MHNYTVLLVLGFSWLYFILADAGTFLITLGAILLTATGTVQYMSELVDDKS